MSPGKHRNRNRSQKRKRRNRARAAHEQAQARTPVASAAPAEGAAADGRRGKGSARARPSPASPPASGQVAREPAGRRLDEPRRRAQPASAVLQTRGLEARYGDFQALFGIDFELNEGETVAIIGANGAGKTTFLRSICGLLPAAPDSIRLFGEAAGGRPAHRIVRMGVAMTPEGRQLFPSLSVEENLLMGQLGAGDGRGEGEGWDLDAVYELFPILRERRNSPGTQLSGGQQQMVAIGRALMSNPRILLCDEISLGLAPTIIKDIYAALPRIRARGAAIVVVEQDIRQALDVADRFYCFQEGRVSLSGGRGSATLDQIAAAYFGT